MLLDLDRRPLAASRPASVASRRPRQERRRDRVQIYALRQLRVRRRAVLVIELSLDALLVLVLLFYENTQTVEEKLLVVALENQLVFEHLHHVLVGRRHRVIVVEK